MAYYIARADNTPAGAVELETAGFTPPLTAGIGSDGQIFFLRAMIPGGIDSEALLVVTVLGRSLFGLRLALWRSSLREYDETEQDQPIGDRERR